jgi:hypothetical protein
VVYQNPDHIRTRINFSEFLTLFFYNAFFLPFNMSVITEEARIIIAIEAIQTSKKLSRRKAVELYKVLFSTLNGRINGRTTLLERRLVNTKLSKLEERVIIRYILDLDSRGFAPRLAGVTDIVNYILESRERERVRQL